MKNFLITGVAGTIGRVLRSKSRDRYNLRLTAINTLDDLDYAEDFVKADLRDFEAIKNVTAGMDAVVHLGGIIGEGSWEDFAAANSPIAPIASQFMLSPSCACYRRTLSASDLGHLENVRFGSKAASQFNPDSSI